MRQEYNIDHLYTYKTISADPNRLVPNPHKQTIRKESNKVKSQIDKYMKEYGEIKLQEDNDSDIKSNNKSKCKSNIKSNVKSNNRSSEKSKDKRNSSKANGGKKKKSENPGEQDIIKKEKKIKELKIKHNELKEQI